MRDTAVDPLACGSAFPAAIKPIRKLREMQSDDCIGTAYGADPTGTIESGLRALIDELLETVIGDS